MALSIIGLDKLSNDLNDAATALGALDGAIATVNFDPEDSASVNAAIREMETAIDQKVARYRSNPLVANLAKQMKARYREAIIERARQARGA